MNRYTRQIRLAEIGEAGQARLASVDAPLGGAGFAREIERTYLRLAGARPVDEGRAVMIDSKGENAGVLPARLPVDVASLGLRDESAREVGEGALRALASLRRTLEIER